MGRISENRGSYMGATLESTFSLWSVRVVWEEIGGKKKEIRARGLSWEKIRR